MVFFDGWVGGLVGDLVVFAVGGDEGDWVGEEVGGQRSHAIGHNSVAVGKPPFPSFTLHALVF